MAATTVKVPALGESVTEATVAQWLKKPGDAIKADEPLVELETDKITLEVNAPASGVLSEIIAETGSSVEVGATLAMITEGAAPAAKANQNTAKEEKKTAAPTPAPQPAKAAPAPASKSAADVLSPAVKKIVAENDVDPAKVAGTGKDGRITKGDVISHLETPSAKTPSAAAFTPAPAAKSSAQPDARGEERVKMTKLRQTIARRLKESQNTAAMLTTFNEVDMSAVMALRTRHQDTFVKKNGIKLGFMSLFVKAAVNALRDVPSVNAQIDGDELIYKNYYDISVAVGTEEGLVVPVVRNADKLSFAGIEKELANLAQKARDGKLTVQDMMGGTFTITNGGIYGSMMSTPILNPPQSGILGMHNIVQRPMVVDGGKIEARPMMYIALTYDHRIIDGKEAVTFLVKIKQAIENPELMLLDV